MFFLLPIQAQRFIQTYSGGTSVVNYGDYPHPLEKNVECDTARFDVLLLSTRSSWLMVLFQPFISFLFSGLLFFLIIIGFVSSCFPDLFDTKEAKLLSHGFLYLGWSFFQFYSWSVPLSR